MSTEETHPSTRSPDAPFRVASALKRIFARDGARAILILIFILNVVFFPCIWGNTTMLASAQLSPSLLANGAWPKPPAVVRFPKSQDDAAAAWYLEPSLAVTAHQYWNEATIPLWNPYQAFGIPFAAAMQPQPFYPLTIALSLHLTPFTYTLFLLTRLFVAGICAYFYLRLFVSFLSALAGAIASMLGGYYLLYMTMPHLSVETLLPATLLSSEYLLRSRTHKSLFAFSAVLFLVIVGGMPESSVLLLVFLYSYLIFRIASDPQVRHAWIAAVKRILLASVAGLCLSAILLLPFLEFVRHSFNVHDPGKLTGELPGLFHDSLPSMLFTYFFPLLFGQFWGLRNYFGLVAFFLMLVAAIKGFRSPGRDAEPTLNHLTWFFWAALLLVLMKRFGIPPVQNFGTVPILREVFFFKYEEFILSGCAAVLCGIGLERLIKGHASVVVRTAALGVSFLMAPLAAFLSYSSILKGIGEGQIVQPFPQIAIGVAVSALFCVAIALIFFSENSSQRTRMAVGWAMVFCLTFELSANYVAPLYYTVNHLARRYQNPYAGAPYIDFLKSKSGRYRIVGRDSVLYPDWASAFQLFDVRDLDAIYYWKYLPFIRNFLGPPAEVPGSRPPDLYDRFTGAAPHEYPFSTPLEKRLLQLSSVRFLIAARPYSDPSFQPVYDREVKIYGYTDVLPRAALFYRAQPEPNAGEVLKKLADPALDVFETVVLDRSQLKAPQLAVIAELNRGAPRRVEAATITSYRSQQVDINAALSQSGILVLNDADYPGWKAEVDGTAAKSFTANYLFRAVMLPPGRHVIRFVYRPRTFYEGSAIAVIALLGLTISGLFRMRRRPHAML